MGHWLFDIIGTKIIQGGFIIIYTSAIWWIRGKDVSILLFNYVSAPKVL